LPAEWEPQDAVLLQWPHARTDWRPYLDDARRVFLDIAAAVTRFEKLIVACPDPEEVDAQLREKDIRSARVDLWCVPTDDTWARDAGPITVTDNRNPVLLDFTFNGWGGKFDAKLDNRATRELHRQGAFGGTPIQTIGLVLEGGSIDSDGRGTLLTTAQCLLNPNRNPALGKAELEAVLTRELGITHFLWLHHGALEGDDTDSHIDTLARLCPGNTILYVQCDDPNDQHADDLAAMEQELKAFRTAPEPAGSGAAFRLLPLPMAPHLYDDDGSRLPATYANFLVINGAVLVPTYGAPAADGLAQTVIAAAFPGREIIGIDCRTLVRQHGSLHCVTMNLPAGVTS
jgi:agmatine deiminase